MQIETLNFNSEAALFGKATSYRYGLNQHRKGVKLLGLELLNRRPDAFPSLASDPECVGNFLEIHDQAKLQPKYFWEMLRFFGVNFKTLAYEQRLVAQSLVFEMNSVDQENARMFFESNGLIDADGQMSSKAIELLRIERIADAVERGSSRISSREFGRKLTKGSEFLSDATDVELALCLETHSVVVA